VLSAPGGRVVSASGTRRRRAGRRAGLVALAASVGLLAACTGGIVPPPTTTPAPSGTPAPSPTPPADPIAGMTLEQRVGQLFMVGTPASGAASGSLDAVRTLQLGGVFLSGRSAAGSAATAAVVAAFTALVADGADAGVPLFVATDQEGGQVQVLSGPGFERIPSALEQGASDPAELRSAAQRWGVALAMSGVNMDLAPVVDLVPSAAAAKQNPPIGGFDREFGYDPATIVTAADAFRGGMAAAGVVPVLKHFPGLGEVTANTDTTAGVVDTVTTASSPSVGIFRTEIEAGAPVVMVSTAIYQQLDPGQPAAFSSAIVTGLLRQQLGFDGLVMSDDLSAAQQVAAWSPADRAILALRAGVDIVLVSTDPALVGQMVAAVVAEARADPAFAAIVDAATRRVVEAKQALLG